MIKRQKLKCCIYRKFDVKHSNPLNNQSICRQERQCLIFIDKFSRKRKNKFGKMCDSTIFDNQNIDETVGDKVDSMDKCVESCVGEELRRKYSYALASLFSSEQSDRTDGCICCEEQHPTAAADNHQLKDVKTVGVHKQFDDTRNRKQSSFHVMQKN